MHKLKVLNRLHDVEKPISSLYEKVKTIIVQT